MTGTPTTYSEVIEEVTDGLKWDNNKQDYKIIQEGIPYVWSTSNNAYEDVHGYWWISGDEVTEEIQRRAAELGIEDYYKQA